MSDQQPSETTPLLGKSTKENEETTVNVETRDDPTAQETPHPEEQTKTPWKSIFFASTLFLLFSFATIYYIILPRRIQRAINNPDGFFIDSVSVGTFQSRGIDLELNAHSELEVSPPVKVTLKESKMDLVLVCKQPCTRLKHRKKARSVNEVFSATLAFFGLDIPHWIDDPYLPLVSFGALPLPEIVTPPGTKELPVVISSQLHFHHIFQMVHLLNDLFAPGGEKPTDDVYSSLFIRMQSIAPIQLPYVGTFKVPMYSYSPIYSNQTSNTSFLNLVGQPQPDFDDSGAVVVQLTFDFNLPIPVTLQPPLPADLAFVVQYHNISVLNVLVKRFALCSDDQSTCTKQKKGGAFGYPVNQLKVTVHSILKNADTLSSLIQDYSEGVPISVQLKSFKWIYPTTERVLWMDDFVKELFLEIHVPPAEADNSLIGQGLFELIKKSFA